MSQLLLNGLHVRWRLVPNRRSIMACLIVRMTRGFIIEYTPKSFPKQDHFTPVTDQRVAQKVTSANSSSSPIPIFYNTTLTARTMSGT